jgi:hypothetical protein
VSILLSIRERHGHGATHAGVLAVLVAGALAAPAPAATLDAPGSVAAREAVAVTARGLEPGRRWAVFLAKEDANGLNCLARLARRTAREGGPTVFSGTVPASLPCPNSVPPAQPAPPPPGAPLPVEPGRGYRFVVCVPAGRDCRFMPVARRPVRIVRTGTACRRVVFTPASDHGAFSIRARNVACALARDVVRGAAEGDRRYRRAGLRCRGTFDPAGLPRTVYRCTRQSARVTFVAS